MLFRSVVEGSSSSPPIPYAKAAADVATPVVPGPQETTATVTVTFLLG